MITFTDAIRQEVDLSLKNIGLNMINDMTKVREAIAALEKIFNKLRMFVREYQFKDNQEEILFFKNIKPKIFWRLIYFQKVYNFEMSRPPGGELEQRLFLEKELVYIHDFFEKNRAFYAYYRSEQIHMDDHLFLRTIPDIYINYESFFYERDPLFSTACDFKLTKLIANEAYQQYILNELEKLSSNYPSEKSISSTIKLRWTISKVDLIELIYGLHRLKCFNDGKATLKEIKTGFESFFDIDLGDLSRTLYDISFRKKPTQFLDRLKSAVTNLINKYLNNNH